MLHSCPPRYRAALAFSSVPLPLTPPAFLAVGLPPKEERWWVYHVSLRQRWMIQPLPTTPAVPESVCLHAEDKHPDCLPFGWSLSASLARYI